MQLNTFDTSGDGKKKKRRLGRGIGSGFGKTSTKGHKGQKARAGGYHKVGFEGGQMPLQRRLPKFGFVSRKSLTHEEIRLGDLNRMTGDVVSMDTLALSGLIKATTKTVKIFASGTIERALIIQQLPVSSGARDAIAAAGGRVEE